MDDQQNKDQLLDEQMDEGFEKLLGGHVIGPLVVEYENHIRALTKDVRMLKLALKSQRDA